MGRTSSQNVLFHGASPDNDPFEPPGRSVARAILCHLRTDGFSVAEEDNWRDGGWSLVVDVSGAALQVAMVKTRVTNQWFAQVAPLKEPGFLGQMFGRKFTDRSAEVLSVSRSIDRGLREAGFTGILWRVDGFPNSKNSTPEPIAPTGWSDATVHPCDQRSWSPDRQHLAEHRYQGEIRFGPPYYFLQLNGHRLDERVFGHAHAWSADSKYLAVQEWHTIVESEGPVTSLVVIDITARREATLKTVEGAFLVPDAFEGSVLGYHVEQYRSGATDVVPLTADLGSVLEWSAIKFR